MMSDESDTSSTTPLSTNYRPVPDPPPNTVHAERIDVNIDEQAHSQMDIVDEILNKPDEEVTLRDVLRFINSCTKGINSKSN